MNKKIYPLVILLISIAAASVLIQSHDVESLSFYFTILCVSGLAILTSIVAQRKAFHIFLLFLLFLSLLLYFEVYRLCIYGTVDMTLLAAAVFLSSSVVAAYVLVKGTSKLPKIPHVKTLFIIALVAGLLIRLFVMGTTAPQRDVPYLDEQATDVLLKGQNPYTAAYENVTYMPAGTSIVPYLPSTIIYLTPFHLIGDVRLGGIFADMLIAICVFLILKKRSETLALLCSVFWLFFPLSIVSTSIWGYNTMIGVSFLMLAFLLLDRGKIVFAGVSFGLSLAALQFTVAVLPVVFYYAFRKKQLKFIIVSLLTCAIIVLPFAIGDIHEFLWDVVFCKIGATIFLYNVSLCGIGACFGYPEIIPTLGRVLILFPFLFFLLRKIDSFEKLLFNTTLFTLIFLFIFPRELFYNYLLMPAVLILVSVSERGHVKLKRRVTLPRKTPPL